MHLASTLAFVVVAAPLASQCDLRAAALVGRTEMVLTGLPPDSVAGVLLGSERRPTILLPGLALDLEPLSWAALGIADGEGAFVGACTFPAGYGAGLAFLLQGVAAMDLASSPPFATTPLRERRIPAADDEVDLVILCGQSNADGQAPVNEISTPLRAPFPEVRIFVEARAEFRALQATVNNTTSRVPYWCGPELALADALRGAGRTVYLLKFAVGGTTLGPTPGPWNEWGADASELYPELRARLVAATAALRAQGFRPRLRGVLWMQGESDATDAALAAGYAPRLRALIARLRGDATDLGVRGAAVAPFVIGQIDAGLVRAGAPHTRIVRAAQAAVALTTFACVLVDTTGMPRQPDGVHLDAAGVTALGVAFAQALAR